MDLKFIDPIKFNHHYMRTTLLFLFILITTVAGAQVRPLSNTINRSVYTVPNTSFFPDFNLGYTNGNAGDGIAYAEGGSGVRILASVQLPHGAIVDSAHCYFIDYADADMYITLAGYENASGAAGLKEFFTSTTFGKSSSVRMMKAPISTINIDNARNSYYLCVQPKTGAWPKKPEVMGIRSVVFFYH
jgi:hypothetical protein